MHNIASFAHLNTEAAPISEDSQASLLRQLRQERAALTRLIDVCDEAERLGISVEEALIRDRALN